MAVVAGEIRADQIMCDAIGLSARAAGFGEDVADALSQGF
jgi:hypothetical protein